MELDTQAKCDTLMLASDDARESEITIFIRETNIAPSRPNTSVLGPF